MKLFILILLMFSTNLFSGILDEDKYWAYTFTALDGDHSYSEKLVMRTYKDGTYKVFHLGKETEKGTLKKFAYELYVMVSSTGAQTILETQGGFAIMIRSANSKRSFINLTPPESYLENDKEDAD